MSLTMKLWERVVEARLRKEVMIGDQQFGFMTQRTTIDDIFGLRMMMEKWKEGQKKLNCVFIDLEKAYDLETNCGSVCFKPGSQSVMLSPSKTFMKRQEHQ